jgi:hypothetical protein
MSGATYQLRDTSRLSYPEMPSSSFFFKKKSFLIVSFCIFFITSDHLIIHANEHYFLSHLEREKRSLLVYAGRTLVF